MIRRLATNPAVLVLVVLAVLSVAVAVWGVHTSATDQGFTTEGGPTEEQLWQFRLMHIASRVPSIVTSVGVAALLGILVIASASRPRIIPSRAEELT